MENKDKLTIAKVFWSWQFEEEIAWINDMAKNGWNFVKLDTVCLYHFEKGKPNEYVYQMELLDKKGSKDYIDFLKDVDIELVCKAFDWAYFRRKNTEENFDMYSDIESKVEHLKRVRNLLLFCLACELFVLSLSLSVVFYMTWLMVLSITLSVITLFGIYKIHKKGKSLTIDNDV